MAISQLTSMRAQFPNTDITVSELTGGTLPMGFAGFIFVSARNRAGRNILSTSVPFTIAVANARLQVTINASILTTGDDVRRVLISYAAADDATQAQQIAAFERYAVDQTTENTLPVNIIFSNPNQFTPLSVASDANLPDPAINGMIVEITNDAQFYEFSTQATAGAYPGTGGFWVATSFTGFTDITATTAADGCDLPLRSIGANFIAPPIKTGSNDSIPIKYLYLNGRTEGTGTALLAGTRLNVLITNNGENVTEQMGGLVVYRLLGYVRYSTAVLDTSNAQADRIWYPTAPPILPTELLPGFGALYEVFYRFTPEEIAAVVPDGFNLSFYFDDSAIKGVPSANFSLTGNTVWNIGERLRIYPGIRSSGQATIENFDTPFVPQQPYTGLLPDTANQLAFMTATVAGDVRIRQSVNDKLDTEAQRAIVGTVPGDGPPSPVSNDIVLAAPGALQVTVTNDNNGVDRWNIRDTYVDRIAGVEDIATLGPRLKIFIDDGVNIYEYNQITAVGFSQTSIVTITTLAGSAITPLPNPGDAFFLYQVETAPVLADGGAGTVPAGTYRVYAVYTSNASPNFLPTSIDHDEVNNNIPENSGDIASLSTQFAKALNPLTTTAFVVPAVGADVTIGINSTSLLVVGANIFIEDAGTYTTISFTPTDGVFRNIGAVGNAAPGTNIPTARSIAPSGPEGPQGPQGLQGSTGGYKYLFNASTTMADPGAGNFRLNNVTPGSATAIAISAQTAETGNPSIGTFLATWANSTSIEKGNLQVTDESTPEEFVQFRITSVVNNTTWFQINGSVDASDGTLTDDIRVLFVRTGDKGDTGNTGASGSPGVSEGLDYDFVADVTISNPGNGNIKVNNATYSLVTNVSISGIDKDTNNVADFIRTWDDSTSPIKSTLKLQQKDAPTNFAIYQITSLIDNTTWFNISVTHVSSSTGPFVGELGVTQSRVGDIGGTGAQGNRGVAGDPYIYSNTTAIADPGNGNVRFDSTTFTAVTQIAISARKAETGFPSIADYIRTWDDSTTVGNRGIVRVSNQSNPENYVIFNINNASVDNTTWFTLNVAFVDTAGVIVDNDTVEVLFVRTGDIGGAGPAGTTPALPYLFDAATAIADPGVGDIRLNNATLNLVTDIAISGSIAAAGNPSVSAFINTWDDSTDPVNGFIQVKNTAALENFAIYRLDTLTDNTGWFSLSVTHISSSGAFAGGNNLAVEFFRTGNQGSAINTTDGTTNVTPTSTLTFDPGFSVTDGGGGDAQINYNIPGLTEDTNPDESADFVLVYDTSDTSHKRVLLENLEVGYEIIESNGAPLTQRGTLNFTGGGVTAADAGGKTEVNVPATYDTAENAGAPVTQRTTLNFTGAGVTVTDDAGKTRVDIPGGAGYSTVQDEGIGLTQRNVIDFVGAGVTAVDSAGKTVVTIPGGGGGGGYDTIQDEGSALTQRSIINFTGAGVTASDGGTSTTVNIPGGGGSVDVTDGTTTVSPASTINFTSGATVTDAGGGVADVAIVGGGAASNKVVGTVVFEQTVTAPVANIDFTSVPSGYDYFIVEHNLGTSQVGADFLTIYFNGDTTNTNYDRDIISDGGPINRDQSPAISSIGTTNRAAHFRRVEIFDYEAPSIRTRVSTLSPATYSNVTDGRIELAVIYWNNTATVTTMRFVSFNGANLTSGTVKVIGYRNEAIGGGGTTTAKVGETLVDETLTVNTTTLSFPTSPFPAGYDYFEVYFFAQSTSGTDEDIEITINGDTTAANYFRHSLTQDGATLGGGSSTNRDIAKIALSSDTSQFSLIKMLVWGHEDTSAFTSFFIDTNTSEAEGQRIRKNHWRNTAVVTSIDFNVEGAGQFAIGTRFVVLGYKDVTLGGGGGGSSRVEADQSGTNNNWYKLPGSDGTTILVQWGLGVPPGASVFTITFEEAFANTNYRIVGTVTGGLDFSTRTVQFGSLTTTTVGAAVSVNNTPSSAQFFWIAIGEAAVATAPLGLAGIVELDSFTVGTLPSVTPAGRTIYVSDETGGAVLAFSDGTNWRRVTDRAIVS